MRLRVLRSLAILAVLLATLGALLAPAPTLGASELKFGLRPAGDQASQGFFSLTLKPGKTGEYSVELDNYAADPVKLRVYAADAYTMVNGGLNARTSTDKQTGTTTWLTFPTAEVTLDGGKAEVRSFTIHVPKKTKPGDYLTCLVLENADPVKGSGGVAVDQVIRQVVAIAIDVPGDRAAKLDLGPASYVTNGTVSDLVIGLHNSGNTHLHPAGKLTVANAAGKTVYQGDVTLNSIYAGDETTMDVRLSSDLPPGDYTAALSLTDDAKKLSVSQTLPFTVAAPATPEVATPVAPQIQITSLTINEGRDAATKALQAVECVVSIDNPGAPVSNGRLTLHVTRDGQLVEDLVLGSALSFPGGASEIRQRYLPLSGWTPGKYEFSVKLESVDPNTGTAVTLAEATAAAPVIAP